MPRFGGKPCDVTALAVWLRQGLLNETNSKARNHALTLLFDGLAGDLHEPPLTRREE